MVFSVLYGRYTTERIFLKLSLMKIVKYKYCIFILYDKNIPFYMDFYIQNKCYYLYFITNIVITFNMVYFYRDLLILDEYDDFYIILS